MSGGLDEAGQEFREALAQSKVAGGALATVGVKCGEMKKILQGLRQRGVAPTRMGSTLILLHEVEKINAEQLARMASLTVGIEEMMG